MPPLPFDVVVFDLDGTLADTAPDLAAALNHSLAALGRPPIDPAGVRNLIGHGARALLQRGLAATGGADQALVERGFPAFMEFYAANLCVATRGFAGVDAALDTLAARGARLAVCTNKPETLARPLIDALGWGACFAAIVGGDTLPVRKPDPAPLHAAIAQAGGGRAVMIGDSITDADTARAAGVPFVAVSFGYSDRPADALGADAVIGHFNNLEAVLDRLARSAPLDAP